jgi:hypothetical protein
VIDKPSEALRLVLDELVKAVEEQSKDELYVCVSLLQHRQAQRIDAECYLQLWGFISEHLDGMLTYSGFYVKHVLDLDVRDRRNWPSAKELNQYRAVWVNSMINYFKERGM